MPFKTDGIRLVDKDVKTIPLGNLPHCIRQRSRERPVPTATDLLQRYVSDKRLGAAADFADVIGTDSLSKQQFGKALEALGSRIEINATDRTFNITLSGFGPQPGTVYGVAAAVDDQCQEQRQDVMTLSPLQNSTRSSKTIQISRMPCMKLEFATAHNISRTSTTANWKDER